MLTEVFNLGPVVICDFCNVDYADKDNRGGLLFESKGVCPACAPALEKDCARYGELKYIRERAKEGESFKDFILRIRQRDSGTTDAVMTITSFGRKG